MRLLMLFAAIGLIALIVACGDDDDSGATSTPPVFQLPRHLQSVTPEPNAQVTNADLPIGEEDATEGVCAGFAFQEGEGMGDEPTSRVTMTLGGEPVTDSIVWVVTDDLPTSMGTGCYAPPVDLEPGAHEVVVHYSDSTDRQFEYTWQFEITD
jgi:hypothetical protein